MRTEIEIKGREPELRIYGQLLLYLQLISDKSDTKIK